LTIDKPDVKNSIKDYAEDENAYICHSIDHWIAIRKIDGVWYNLNSTNIMPPGPQIISNFYLNSFLDSIKSIGYRIFVIRGNSLPLPNKSSNSSNIRPNQHYISVHDIEKFHKDNKNRKLNMSGADERELEEALKKSLLEYNKKGN
jgi:ataxin-3